MLPARVSVMVKGVLSPSLPSNCAKSGDPGTTDPTETRAGTIMPTGVAAIAAERSELLIAKDETVVSVLVVSS